MKDAEEIAINLPRTVPREVVFGSDFDDVIRASSIRRLSRLRWRSNIAVAI